jgi:hypothetical protein
MRGADARCVRVLETTLCDALMRALICFLRLLHCFTRAVYTESV